MKKKMNYFMYTSHKKNTVNYFTTTTTVSLVAHK